MEDIKTGLWRKTSKSNNTYFSGSFEINGKKYSIRAFNNTDKKTDKSPDINLIIGEWKEYKKDTFEVEPTIEAIKQGFATMDSDIPF